MSLTRRNPNSEFNALRRLMDRAFADDFLRPIAEWPADGPDAIPVDVADQGNALLVKASVPGIPAEDIQVEVKDNILSISGELKQDKESQEQSWFVQEHRYGRFERRVRLPVPVDSSKVEATLKNGMLTLTLPKQAITEGSRIKVLASS